MKVREEIVIPVGLALFAAILFALATALPAETIYHHWCKFKAQEFPEKYSICAQCGYWFSHKDMKISELETGYRWDCDECYSKQKVYE